jgi:hypothetical protein
MPIQRTSRVAWWRPLAWLLFFLALLAGLLAMHGLQASPSPVDLSGIPRIGSDGAAAMDGHSDHESKATKGDPSHPAPPHKHHGGQVCLGLLMMASLLGLLTPVRWRRCSPRSVATGPSLPSQPGRGGRPPPSLFALSVLRL